jgi:hypothetical protein
LLTSAINVRAAVKRQPATFNALARDLFHQRNRRSPLMLFPLRNTRCVPLLEQHCDSTLEDIRVKCSKNWDGGSSVFLPTHLSPVGRSAKMPAVFSFQESFTLLAK